MPTKEEKMNITLWADRKLSDYYCFTNGRDFRHITPSDQTFIDAAQNIDGTNSEEVKTRLVTLYKNAITGYLGKIVFKNIPSFDYGYIRTGSKSSQRIDNFYRVRNLFSTQEENFSKSTVFFARKLLSHCYKLAEKEGVTVEKPNICEGNILNDLLLNLLKIENTLLQSHKIEKAKEIHLYFEHLIKEKTLRETIKQRISPLIFPFEMNQFLEKTPPFLVSFSSAPSFELDSHIKETAKKMREEQKKREEEIIYDLTLQHWKDALSEIETHYENIDGDKKNAIASLTASLKEKIATDPQEKTKLALNTIGKDCFDFITEQRKKPNLDAHRHKLTPVLKFLGNLFLAVATFGILPYARGFQFFNSTPWTTQRLDGLQKELEENSQEISSLEESPAP